MNKYEMKLKNILLNQKLVTQMITIKIYETYI